MPVRVGLKLIEMWNSSMEKEVCKYESEPTDIGQIVFYGPSNFTRWSEKYGNLPLRKAVLGKSGAECCVNRGFGSSCSEHHLYYYPRMIRPLEPKVLVYANFGNGEDFGYSLEEVWELGQRVATYAHTDFPDCHIYLLGANYRRSNNEERIQVLKRYNSWLKEFAEKTPNCFFIETNDFEPLKRKDIYAPDGVHFNEEGYKYYAEFFKEVLKEELECF